MTELSFGEVRSKVADLRAKIPRVFDPVQVQYIKDSLKRDGSEVLVKLVGRQSPDGNDWQDVNVFAWRHQPDHVVLMPTSVRQGRIVGHQQPFYKAEIMYERARWISVEIPYRTLMKMIDVWTTGFVADCSKELLKVKALHRLGDIPNMLTELANLPDTGEISGEVYRSINSLVANSSAAHMMGIPEAEISDLEGFLVSFGHLLKAKQSVDNEVKHLADYGSFAAFGYYMQTAVTVVYYATELGFVSAGEYYQNTAKVRFPREFLIMTQMEYAMWNSVKQAIGL